MKKYILVLISALTILLLTVSLIGCGKSQTATQTPTTQSAPTFNSANNTFTDPEHGFSVACPADWDYKADLTGLQREAGVVAIFEGPSSPQYGYRVNIQIEAENLGAELTADEYAAGVENYILKNNLPNYSKIDEQKTTVAGLPAVIRVFTATTTSAMYKYTQKYFTKGETGYAITYAATEDIYEKYYRQYSLVIDSFKWN